MLKIQTVTKNYGSHLVLDKIDLEVDTETKALVGINGSGKSTLLKIICGILRVDQGNIAINNRDVSNLPPEKRRIGYVPQHPALFSHMTIKDNIRYGMRNDRGSETTYQQVVEVLDLKDVLEKRPGQLSGGYQHRTSLARALAPEPEALLLDEPLSGMDAVLKVKLLPKSRDIMKSLKVPVLYVTHDPEEAQALADSFAAIIDGRVHAVESAQTAFSAIRGS